MGRDTGMCLSCVSQTT
ncbi:hypothetical protein F383_25443 [Gossypium arboreum]|uniref:Uncharacterized protein n=1 Tax=Gossypium arboreum TaxID=29729 RepID=A0A0B0NYL0_GOSAR|nr:hypothetical protein F383_25443 [Gossypium arboreum]